ncbi:MAG: trimeric intracellular cation channel family protein [Fluviicola sp.]
MFYTTADIVFVVDIVGTLVFAISGALAAGEKRFDLMGVAIIAFVTAVGGGTIRDLLIGSHPVGWMQNYQYILLTSIGVLLVFFLHPHLQRFRKSFFLFDAIGLGTFAIAGMEKALSYGINPGYAILCGMITGCFGGLTRDVLCNEIPLIFRKEMYAFPALAGASAYLGLDTLGVIPEVSLPLTIILVTVFRIFAVRYDWGLPRIRM